MSYHGEGIADATDVTYTPTTSGDWLTPPDDVAEAADELAGRVQAIEDAGGGGIGVQPETTHAFIDQFLKVSGSFSMPLSRSTSSSFMHGFAAFQSSAADGDSMEVAINLQSGTYTLVMLGHKDTNRGLLDWSLNGGAAFVSGQDWYNGSPSFNTMNTGTLVIPTSGRHVLRFTVNGKNGSSSGYAFALTAIWVYPSSYSAS